MVGCSVGGKRNGFSWPCLTEEQQKCSLITDMYTLNSYFITFINKNVMVLSGFAHKHTNMSTGRFIIGMLWVMIVPEDAGSSWWGREQSTGMRWTDEEARIWTSKQRRKCMRRKPGIHKGLLMYLNWRITLGLRGQFVKESSEEPRFLLSSRGEVNEWIGSSFSDD